MDPNILPAERYSDKIRDVIVEHQTVIICGQTGCGKSTIVPQIILDEIVDKNTCIAVTQPRRVAACSLAFKVASDRAVELGKEIGYKYRFDNKTSDETRLVYLTDGMLLKEYSNDKQLRKYSCIVLDEVHERSIASDILMYCLRKLQIERNESRRKLKIVLMSATMDLEPLKHYFNAPAFHIPGRLHDVELFYCDSIAFNRDDHVNNAVKTVLQLHDSEPVSHSFLVFLTGQEEIESACRSIKKHLKSLENVRIIPFYAQRRQADVDDIFRVNKNARKIIVATNIAETSITIPDVRIVIDSGKVKQRRYAHDRRLSILEVLPVSKAQAIQRAGRAGRCETGKCYRLYSKAAYETLDAQTVPEILRCSLSEVLLSLFATKVTTIQGLKFLDNPPGNEWCAALDELVAFEFIEASDNNQSYSTVEYFKLVMDDKLGLNYTLTEMGERIKQLPLSPMLSRLILMGDRFKCLQEVVTIAAFCSTDDIFLPLESMTQQEREEHAILLRSYHSTKGDLSRLINIYRVFKKGSKADRYKNCSKSGLNGNRFEEVMEIRKQLREICLAANFEFESEPYQSAENLENAIINSFFLNVCVYSQQNGYVTLAGKEVVTFHPSSCLSRQYPTTVVYVELVRTTKVFMRLVTPIERSLLKSRLEELNLSTKLVSYQRRSDVRKSGEFFKPNLKHFT